ncbi:MAG: transposase [Chloroflexota bacterium]|nr:transposase [Chloroflexota bacterium]
MLTHILHNSEQLCAFIDQLDLGLSQPQRRHILNLADALLVCEARKTLAALRRQFVTAPDVSNMADCLRISPWTAANLRQAVGAWMVRWAIQQADQTDAPKVIYINLDDSIAAKHKHTRHIEGVDWHYDHIASTKHRPHYKNGLTYLVCTVAVGTITVTFDLRLYLRASTVRRINRRRVPAQRLHFVSKLRLARRMLEALRPLLPRGWEVTVQFDSWYAAAQLLKYIHRQGWHTVCGLKSNRKLNGKRLDQHARALWHQRYTPVAVTAADGTKTTYLVRTLTGRLQDLAFDVRVFASRRHYRDQHPAYFASTDLTLPAHKALQGYDRRWSCEVDNFYLKTQVGLADFRVQPYEAVDKWCAVVHLAWAYVEWRFAQERSAQVRCPADIIRRHREEHQRDWLRGALQMVLETGDIEPVLARFLPAA